MGTRSSLTEAQRQLVDLFEQGITTKAVVPSVEWSAFRTA